MKNVPESQDLVASDVRGLGRCLSWSATQTSIYETEAHVTKHCGLRFFSRSVLKARAPSQAKGYMTSATLKLFLLENLMFNSRSKREPHWCSFSNGSLNV